MTGKDTEATLKKLAGIIGAWKEIIFFILLKKLSLKDANIEYLKWMNDKEVTKFTEQRFKKHSLSEIKNFINYFCFSFISSGHRRNTST